MFGSPWGRTRSVWLNIDGAVSVSVWADPSLSIWGLLGNPALGLAPTVCYFCVIDEMRNRTRKQCFLCVPDRPKLNHNFRTIYFIVMLSVRLTETRTSLALATRLLRHCCQLWSCQLQPGLYRSCCVVFRAVFSRCVSIWLVFGLLFSRAVSALKTPRKF